MKLAVALVLAPLVASKVSFSQCPGTYPLQIRSITTNPAQLSGGKTMTMEVNGHYSGDRIIARMEGVVQGKAKVGFFNKSIDDIYPLCPYIVGGTKCPVRKGPVKFIVKEEIPGTPVGVSANVRMVIRDTATKATLGCLNLQGVVKSGFSSSLTAELSAEAETFTVEAAPELVDEETFFANHDVMLDEAMEIEVSQERM